MPDVHAFGGLVGGPRNLPRRNSRLPAAATGVWVIAAAALLGVGSPATAERNDPACPASASRSSPGLASREETFASLRALRDCILVNRSAEPRSTPASAAFWPRLLDALLVLLVLGLGGWALMTRRFGRGWTMIVIASVFALTGGRLWLDHAFASRADAQAARRLLAADARWQVEMVRARQTPDAQTANAVAIDATRRLIVGTGRE